MLLITYDTQLYRSGLKKRTLFGRFERRFVNPAARKYNKDTPNKNTIETQRETT